MNKKILLQSNPKKLRSYPPRLANGEAGNLKPNRGFSLIELIIYSGILAIVLAFTGEYLYSIGQARINNVARVEVAQAAQIIISKIKFDIVNSTTISSPAGVEATANLSLSIGDDSVIYSLNNFYIDRNFNEIIDKLNSNQVKVSNLSFNKIANPGGIVTIQVHFTLTSLAQLSGGRNIEESFQTTFSQR
jgi:prepilin-type N-terminal cleavage/methylation domain-containing protein